MRPPNAPAHTPLAAHSPHQQAPAFDRHQTANPPESTKFRFGYLTKQNAAWAALGVNIFGSKFSPADLVKDDDEVFVVAYPSFNPREELSAAFQLYQGAALPTGRCGRRTVGGKVSLRGKLMGGV